MKAYNFTPPRPGERQPRPAADGRHLGASEPNAVSATRRVPKRSARAYVDYLVAAFAEA